MVGSCLVFIYLNLGDRSNHIASIHIPQLFYFFSFTAFFGIAHIMDDILTWTDVKIREMRLQKIKPFNIICVIILTALTAFIISKFT
jgi:alpha-1,2-glucosyltransferase